MRNGMAECTPNLTGFVGCSGDHPALVALASDDYGFAFEGGSNNSSTETKKASMST